MVRDAPCCGKLTHSGVLSCLDGYMNIALEDTTERVDGVVRSSYGDAFIRGNNGTCALCGLFQVLTRHSSLHHRTGGGLDTSVGKRRVERPSAGAQTGCSRPWLV